MIGQFLGIAMITGLSLLASTLALAIPPQWQALMGIIPIGLGLWKLGDWFMQPTDSGDEHSARRSAMHSQALPVALLTIANGGDYLGLYIPLLAVHPRSTPIYAIVFLVLTGLWCLVALGLVRHPVKCSMLRRVGHIALPLVLLGIGGHILLGAEPLPAGQHR